MASRRAALFRAGWCVALMLCAENALADQFAACESAANAQPDSYDSALCFYREATGTGNWEATAEALKRQMQKHPKVAWYPLVFGYVQANNGDTEASSTFTAAAISFLATGNLHGELLARANLRIRYFENGQLQKASKEYARIKEIGDLTDDVEFTVRALVVQGRHLIDTKSDLNAANTALTRAERLTNQQLSTKPDSELPYFLRREILNDLGQLNATFGNYPKAINYFSAYSALAKTNNDLGGAALAGANLANALLELHRVSADEVRFEDLINAAELASQQAVTAQILSLELFSNRVLAEAHAARNPAAALTLTKTCIERAEAAELFWQKSQCLWVQAYALANSNPELATDTIEQAVLSMRRVAAADHAQTSFGWRYLMRIHWLTQPTEQAYTVAQQALDAIEDLRTSQSTGYARSSVFSAWTQDYKWLLGRLLADAAATDNPASRKLYLQRALHIGERMRARGLLESLAASNNEPESDAATALAVQISRLNQALMNANAKTTQGLQSELVALEHQEATARGAASNTAEKIELPKLQAQLNGNEALLVMHIAHENNALEIQEGASWLIGITKDAISLHPMPSAQYLLRAHRAMRSGGKDSALHFSGLLYQRAFAHAFDDLPAGIEHLTLVPDAPLNSLPFAALYNRSTKSPLVQSKTLAVAPSLSTWLRLRTGQNNTLPPRSLVIAAPDLRSYGKQNSSLQIWQDSGPVNLTDLPAARTEAQAVVDALPTSITWLGKESSEAALKQATLSKFGIIHFAAHAVVDDQNSDRSALLLAPGSTTEDGLLQVREIGKLQLDGQLVLLASCQSAIGRDVRGEGVISLSRAFLAAGASAVIGTLWPVRDDTTAELVGHFYQLLSEGVSAASALRGAQLLLRDAGHDEKVWSAFVLHGNGGWRFS